MLDRDRILAAIDLPALADELLGPRTGTARSPTWPCPSPTHAQTGRTPPVTVFSSRSGVERWHCHGCGVGGTAIDLVLATTSLDTRAAIQSLAERTGIEGHGSPPAPRTRPPSRTLRPRITDPEGLRAFVDDCARRLWTPDAQPVLRWLTHARRIPDDVLHANHIGADAGRGRQQRPDGMPGAGWAVVLPIIEDGEAVFAQLRLLSGGPRQRYLNASSRLAPNPRVGLYEPTHQRGSCTLVTEGILDALSAAAAGYRGAALLGAAVPPPDPDHPAARSLGQRLRRLAAPVVTALDADPAGAAATERLNELLNHHGVSPVTLHLPAGVKDLNEWMQRSTDWPQTVEAELRTALKAVPRSPVALGR